MELDMKGWLRKRLDEKRYAHSLAVSGRAVFLAKLNGENEEKAAVAGLLHDCCKCLSHGEQLIIIETRGIMLDKFTRMQPQLWHAPAGAIAAENELDVRDSGVLSAIRLHTTGAKDMTSLEKIIYLADLTSSDREYPDVEKVRALSEQSLDLGMAYCLKYITGMLIEAGRPIVRDTWEAYNNFLKLTKGDKI